jgi:DNA-binding transcriptional MerR regulator
MARQLTVGRLGKQTGLTAKTVRFYEDEGLLPRARRSESGYRLYSEGDVTRLRLVRRLRLLGLGLPAVRMLVDQAFADNCAVFGGQLIGSIARQREEVDRRLQELEALKAELGALDQHVRHCCEGCSPDEMASSCGFCGLITREKGGERDGEPGRPDAASADV